MLKLTLSHPQAQVSMTFIGIPGWALIEYSYSFSLVRPIMASNSKRALEADRLAV